MAARVDLYRGQGEERDEKPRITEMVGAESDDTEVHHLGNKQVQPRTES